MFALQSTAAEPAVTSTLLQTGAMAVTLSNAVDDAMSDDFGKASCCADMLEIAEVDVDKILCPPCNYPLPETTHLKPELRLAEYRLEVSFWLYRPPQRT